MNAGKSTQLLQVRHNYHERQQRTLLLKPHLDNREGEDVIAPRIGNIAAKVDALAQALAAAGPDEVEIATSYLGGSLRQRRTGLDCYQIRQPKPHAVHRFLQRAHRKQRKPPSYKNHCLCTNRQ